MPPTIYLVRHAQGENNIDNSHFIHDAPLTTYGKSQALALRSTFPFTSEIDAVMSSPMRRAIQTASIAFGSIIAQPHIQYTLLPMAQEANGFQCDIGHSPSELKALLPDLLGKAIGFDVEEKVGFGLMKDGWNLKSGVYATDREVVKARAAKLRSWLYQRPESNIVLVTHGAFLHFLTEDWTGDDPVRGTGYHICEVRLFDFTPGSTAEDAHIFERDEKSGDLHMVAMRSSRAKRFLADIDDELQQLLDKIEQSVEKDR